jgi:hypothetical protein
MRRLLALPLFLAVSACNGTPIATQWKLRNFNIATADLAQTRFALGGPPWTMATPERATIEVRYWRDGDDESGAKTIPLRLQKAAHPSDGEALEKAGGPQSLAVIELTPASLAAARAAQQETARLKAEGAKTRGRIHLAGNLGCRRGDIPPGPIAIDIFIHADDETGWLPLNSGLDARQSAKDEAELNESLPPCPGQQAKTR